jgi:YYY domain-containing protein
VILDWLAREGWIIVSWWALVTLAGAAALPLLFRLLGGLPDKGYTLARAAGLLLVGFVYWLLASLGFWRNAPGSILLAWLIVLVGALYVYFSQPQRFDWRGWWAANRRLVLTSELLFALLFLFLAVYRAHMPNLTGTEKPMELAFMSAVQRSTTFPPNDPWLSGYAISYYYFGYVMSAMLSMLSGINSGIGFNMTIALWFALTGLTSFGVVYNLVRSRQALTVSPRAALVCGLLGALFVALLGNYQAPLIEVPYQTRAASDVYLEFWGQSERLEPKPPLPEGADALGLEQWDFWWWFRASRVITDTNLDGSLIGIQPIDEFPAFSFLLADVHPHVLALPFAALALGLALNVALMSRAPRRDEIVLYGVCLGGLVFLNVWDGPIYMAVLVGAEAVRRLRRRGVLWAADWWALLRLGLTLAVLALGLYLPFFIGFRSQASGILPNLLFPTRFQQLFVMFGPFVLLLAAYLLVEMRLGRGLLRWRLGLLAAVGVLVALVGLALLLTGIAALIPAQQAVVLGYIDQNGGLEAVLPALMQRRLAHGLTALVLLGGIAAVVARLFPRRDTDEPAAEAQVYPAASGFVLLIIGAALMLVLIPEYVYLRDNFSVRINTIFKFYYQAWLMFAVASAYGVYVLLADARLQSRAPLLRVAWLGLVMVAIAPGLVYPLLGFHNRAFIESGRLISERPLSLDGGPTLVNSDDYQAIMCLGALVRDDAAVVAEAVGPAYNSGYGRVGALTGIPILLGWENHQGQWRGPTYGEVVGSRPQDIRTLYSDLRWEVAAEILERYGVDYVFYGSSERSQYGAQGEAKFAEHLQAICEYGNSRFYRVDPARLLARG